MPRPTHPKLATLEKGIFLHVYVIIDLFSRYVVGWLVAGNRSGVGLRQTS